eukprot:1983884-Rhodomonas_salina.2
MGGKRARPRGGSRASRSGSGPPDSGPCPAQSRALAGMRRSRRRGPAAYAARSPGCSKHRNASGPDPVLSRSSRSLLRCCPGCGGGRPC